MTYEEFKSGLEGEELDLRFHKMFSIESATELVGFRLDSSEYNSLFQCMGLIWDDIDGKTSNSICFNEYYGVMSHGGDAILTKECIKKIIDKLEEIYDNYDLYFSEFINDCYEDFKKDCKRMRNNMIKPPVMEIVAKETKGYVYVMLHQGYYKIGKTKDCCRLGEYTRLAEEPQYTIITYVEDMVQMERKLHKVFKDKRCREGKCEWFKLDKDDIETAKKILDDNAVQDFEHSKYYRRYILKEEV